MKKPKRRGFSLAVILLISLAGLSVIGFLLQNVSMSSGAGRTASAVNRKYNFLVSEVEAAWSKIVAKKDGDDSLPRRTTAGTITSADMLLVMPEERRALSQRELSLYGLAGRAGDLTVKIYDMQYEQAEVSPLMEPAEISLLPPAVRLIGTGSASCEPTSDDDLLHSAGQTGSAINAGAYLIRALLEVDGIRESAIDLAVVESRKD
jgi:hypothetical protein